MDAGYFRRWYGNFGVTDNLNLAAADFNTFSITAPADPRLPDGGAYTVSGFYDVNPAKVSLPQNNYYTLASNYGEQIQHWNGFDVTINARMRRGFTVQGGVSSGRQETNNCAVIAGLPEAALLTAPYCSQKDNFLTDGKLIGSYEVPKIDVAVSALFYSRPGPAISANRVFPSAEIAPSLGRPLAGNAPNVTVNMVKPGTIYGDRRNQLDLRLTKNFKTGRPEDGRELRDLQRVQHERRADRERDVSRRDRRRAGAFRPRSRRRAAEVQPAAGLLRFAMSHRLDVNLD